MANTPCPGPLDYGDIVAVPDGRYGIIQGYGSPPLEYTVGVTFDATRWGGLSVETQYHSPMQLQRVGHFEKPDIFDYLASRKEQCS